MSTSSIGRANVCRLKDRLRKFYGTHTMINMVERARERVRETKSNSRSYIPILPNSAPFYKNYSSLPLGKIYTLKQFGLTYSLENGVFSPSDLLFFLKNVFRGLNNELEYWVVFRHDVEDCPCITALLFLKEKLRRSVGNLESAFAYRSSIPFIVPLSYQRLYYPWRDSLIYQAPILNFSMRDVFESKEPFDMDQSIHLKGIFQGILYNYRHDLTIVDYSVGERHPDYDRIQDMLAARVLADNRFSRCRADTLEVADRYFQGYSKWFSLQEMRRVLKDCVDLPNSPKYAIGLALSRQQQPVSSDSGLSLFGSVPSTSLKVIVNFLLRKYLGRKISDSKAEDLNYHLKRLKPHLDRVPQIRKELQQFLSSI